MNCEYAFQHQYCVDPLADDTQSRLLRRTQRTMLTTRDGHGLVTTSRRAMPDAHNQTESVSTKQEDTERVKACQYEATERKVRLQ